MRPAPILISMLGLSIALASIQCSRLSGFRDEAEQLRRTLASGPMGSHKAGVAASSPESSAEFQSLVRRHQELMKKLRAGGKLDARDMLFIDTSRRRSSILMGDIDPVSLLGMIRDQQENRLEIPGFLIGGTEELLTNYGRANPAGALRLYELLTAEERKDLDVASAFRTCVSADPREALRWFDGQKAAGNALADDPVMVRNMLRARARLEPAAAVARMAEMTDAAQFTELGESMAKELRNPREYETFLRACADGMADSKEQGAMAKIKEACLRGMAQKMRGWPLEDVRSLADSCLSPEERIKMAGDLNMGIAPGMFEEPVAWADWLAEVGEPTRGFSPISSFMGRWAPQDPEASVAWLRRLPEGLTKSRAVSSYAEAMAETRGSQAISLINENLTGSRHTSTLKTVRSRWRKQDPEGEAAYAREHGLPPL